MEAYFRWSCAGIFLKFGSALSNQRDLAKVFTFICMTTVLIISVVKSSLALSLGLVGALSIVRFRTPIKEPEELAYLFMAIAIGLGLGAGQTIATVSASAVILAAVAAAQSWRRSNESKNLYLSLETPIQGDSGTEAALERLNQAVANHATQCDLRRFDIRDNSMQATYLIDIGQVSSIARLSDDLESSFPGITITFLDQSRVPNL